MKTFCHFKYSSSSSTFFDNKESYKQISCVDTLDRLCREDTLNFKLKFKSRHLKILQKEPFNSLPISPPWLLCVKGRHSLVGTCTCFKTKYPPRSAFTSKSRSTPHCSLTSRGIHPLHPCTGTPAPEGPLTGGHGVACRY